MKILQVGKHYFPEKGGIETVMFDLTEGLNKRGIVCDVLCANTSNQFQLSQINNYKVFRTARIVKAFSTSVSWQYIQRLKELVHNYDILHVHLPDPMANLALMMTQDLNNKTIIVHWHSDIVSKKQKVILPFYRPFQSWLLRKAKAIVCTSSQYLEGSKELIKYKDKCVIIPIGINTEHFNSKNEQVDKIRERYKGKKIIFSLGRHVYYKGFEYLIKAAMKIGDDVVIVIGGEGKLTPTFEKLLSANGLENKVKLVGKIPQDELGAYFEACDIFCLPSILRSEAFGVVLLEAMFYQKPIIGTNIEGSGVNWVNAHGITGLNVATGDVDALAESINLLLKNEQLYNHCVENSSRRFYENFTADKMIDAFCNLYRHLQK